MTSAKLDLREGRIADVRQAREAAAGDVVAEVVVDEPEVGGGVDDGVPPADAAHSGIAPWIFLPARRRRVASTVTAPPPENPVTMIRFGLPGPFFVMNLIMSFRSKRLWKALQLIWLNVDAPDRLALRQQDVSKPERGDLVARLRADAGAVGVRRARPRVVAPARVVGRDGQRVELETVVHEEEVAVPRRPARGCGSTSPGCPCRGTRCNPRRAGTARPPGRRRASARSLLLARRCGVALTSCALPGSVLRTLVFVMNSGVHSEPWEEIQNLAVAQLPRGRHGFTRAEVVASQRARMLDAMARAVAEHGYANTSVRDVITLAGVSRETFYEHFADKAACFRHARRQHRAAARRARRRGVRTRTIHAGFEPAFPPTSRLSPPTALRARLSCRGVRRGAGSRSPPLRHAGPLRRSDRRALGARNVSDRFAFEMLVSAISSLVTRYVATDRTARISELRAPILRLVRRPRRRRARGSARLPCPLLEEPPSVTLPPTPQRVIRCGAPPRGAALHAHP